jgi:4-hydroxybenzoate polyprenyltransferase/phosphoserine phosphatase
VNDLKDHATMGDVIVGTKSKFESISAQHGERIVVDLDGTLIHTDLLVEAYVQLLGQDFIGAVSGLRHLFRGRSAFKHAIATQVHLDASLFPYNEEVLVWLRSARENRGARLYLASASNEKFVEAVATHLGIFDGWIASTADVNLSGQTKADRIKEMLGGEQFTYLGNELADLPIWRSAANCVAVECSPRCQGALLAVAPAATIVERDKGVWRPWLKLLRVHQYAKNVLVAVPLVASHEFTLRNVILTLAAMLAFSLCASSGYIVNDLVDLDADRKHPTKRRRPLANGTVSILAAPIVAMLLLLVAFTLAIAIGWLFASVLAFYLVLTEVYTLSLKRKMVVDAITLAILYLCRVIAGGAAIDVIPSEWLLGISLFLFTSLAFTKRSIELKLNLDADKQKKLHHRNYEVGDLFIVEAIAAACGFNAVTFLALYIASDAVLKLYAHPGFLWIACPVLMYWIGRNLMLAHRGVMDDDPIVFALRDRPSLASAAIIGAAVVLATF